MVHNDPLPVTHSGQRPAAGKSAKLRLRLAATPVRYGTTSPSYLIVFAQKTCTVTSPPWVLTTR
jgi:hypothetical protein